MTVVLTEYSPRHSPARYIPRRCSRARIKNLLHGQQLKLIIVISCANFNLMWAKCALIHEFCILTLYFYCCPLCVSHHKWETVEYGHHQINICPIISCVPCFFSLGLYQYLKLQFMFQSNSVNSASFGSDRSSGSHFMCPSVQDKFV